MSQTADLRGGRIPQLDGLRALAITAVFFSHAYKIRMAWVGVDLFFVLSGFLITGILLNLKHKDLGAYFAHFYERRARRILPPYLLLLLVVSLLFGLAWMKRWYLYLGLTNFVPLFHDPWLTPLEPLWSLGVEEQFYLFWPFVLYFVADRKLPWVAGAMLLLAPVFRVALIPWDTIHMMIYRTTPCRMDCMAMGALLTFVWRSHRGKIERFGYLGLIFPILTPFVMIGLGKLGGFSTMDGTIHGNIFTYEIALCAATGTFLWGLGGRFTGVLTIWPMRALGRISYSFYLIFSSALVLAEARFPNHPLAAATAAAGAISYATLSWLLLEKPILARGNQRSKRIELEAAETMQST